MTENKNKITFKLIIGDKTYKNTGCTKDQNGKRFCIFVRRNGLSVDKLKIAKEDLHVDYKTGECHLLTEVVKSN